MKPSRESVSKLTKDRVEALRKWASFGGWLHLDDGLLKETVSALCDAYLAQQQDRVAVMLECALIVCVQCRTALPENQRGTRIWSHGQIVGENIPCPAWEIHEAIKEWRDAS